MFNMKSLLELCCDKVQRDDWHPDIKKRVFMNNVRAMIEYYNDFEIHGELYWGWISGLNGLIENHPWVMREKRKRTIFWG